MPEPTADTKRRSLGTIVASVAGVITPPTTPTFTHFTPEQLAKRWGLSPRTLEKWRQEGFGPEYLKFGRKKILYPIVKVLAFEQEAAQ